MTVSHSETVYVSTITYPPTSRIPPDATAGFYRIRAESWLRIKVAQYADIFSESPEFLSYLSSEEDEWDRYQAVVNAEPEMPRIQIQTMTVSL